MPGLIEGMQGYAATVANLANKDRVRLQAKIDEHQFNRQQVADEKRDELVAAIGDLDDRERELDANLKLGAVDNAMMGIAEGDWDSFNDFFKVPENRVILQDSPQLADEFGGKVNNIRRFNPEDPNDVAARDKFAQIITKGDSSTYNELFPGMKEYFDKNSLVMADVEGVGPVAMRSDDLLEPWALHNGVQKLVDFLTIVMLKSISFRKSVQMLVHSNNNFKCLIQNIQVQVMMLWHN